MTNDGLEEIREQIKELLEWKRNLFHVFETISKQVDDNTWLHKVADIAEFEKISITGPPPSDYAFQVVKEIMEKTDPVYANSFLPEDSVIIYAYVFKPKGLDGNKKHPLMVLLHGGIHGNFTSATHAKFVRELIEQGYIIIAPDYRGSNGYGATYWNLVDYGPTTVEDIYVSRNWMIENCEQIDEKRVGIMGWSMGGYNTLMNVFTYPEAYSVAFAGVPVSDLLIRLSYRRWDVESRAAVYSGGKVTDQYELRKRSPAWNAEKLKVPLLVHCATNDRDVYITEVENLIAQLKAAGKEFEYKIYQDPPGGHLFEMLDTPLAREAQREIYKFLVSQLSIDSTERSRCLSGKRVALRFASNETSVMALIIYLPRVLLIALSWEAASHV